MNNTVDKIMGSEIIKEAKIGIKMHDDKIDGVAEKMADKMGINVEKAKTELGMGIIMSIMMNRHRAQDIKEVK